MSWPISGILGGTIQWQVFQANGTFQVFVVNVALWCRSLPLADCLLNALFLEELFSFEQIANKRTLLFSGLGALGIFEANRIRAQRYTILATRYTVPFPPLI
jgi:hypothetical protein